ncbi:MAG: threonine--tRNA ligase [Gammaproteobacteria bacterium]|nr:threonine--tRNA ligase [Gammaproteobacteria bacterium]
MPTITLSDGATVPYEHTVTPLQVARDIAEGLARKAVAARVDQRLVDLSFEICADAQVSILTLDDDESLEIVRHSCAHLLAHAVKELHPSCQVTIGPVIKDGFYYDFVQDPGFTAEDLDKIEKRMKEIVKRRLPLEREVMERTRAVEYFQEMGEAYKAEIIASIPEGDEISLYRQGDFVDLCRGPHIHNTSVLRAFKLTGVAGAYWRGDSNNPMLSRIYGTAWRSREELKAHLYRLEQAAKRDHRKLGRQLDWFHFQPEAPGLVFWHPRGWQVVQVIKNYIRTILAGNGYQEINTPLLADRKLWEQSGHWDKYADHMFVTSSENREYAVKPMNCPCHVQVYNCGLRSYRQLPVRLSEFGSCHRNEFSGTLHGLMRVRGFVQDDAHIFCTEDQIAEEVNRFLDLVFEVYRHFGFERIRVLLSTRPEKRIGREELWDKSESALTAVLNSRPGLQWQLNEGEGAFYGPKVEFVLLDCLEREWQCGTIQCDFSMPERLGARYMDENSVQRTPVMLHRAILGSIERFVGILIEHYAGLLPFWLAPVQVVVMTISEQYADYASTVHKTLLDSGFRAEIDTRNEKIGYKIREHTVQKIPCMLIAGAREALENTVSLRLHSGADVGQVSLDGLAQKLREIQGGDFGPDSSRTEA